MRLNNGKKSEEEEESERELRSETKFLPKGFLFLLLFSYDRSQSPLFEKKLRLFTISWGMSAEVRRVPSWFTSLA